MFQNMADSETSLVGLSFLESLGTPEMISPSVLPLKIDPGPDKVLKAILKLAEREFVSIRASRSQLSPIEGEAQPFTTIVVRDVSEEIL